MKLTYPSIPDPTNTVDSLLNTVRALKQSMEQITGQRANGAAAHVFAQDDPPTAIAVGDFWIDTNAKSALRYWNGNEWVLISSPTYP